MKIERKNGWKGEFLLLSGIETAAGAVAELEESSDGSIIVPSKLRAASSVIAKAEKASTLQEKERLLSSVIAALDRDENLRFSSANARACAALGKARYEAKQYNQALLAVEKSLEILPHTGAEKIVGKFCLRVAADVQRALGNVEETKGLLQALVKVDPQASTKLAAEIASLKDIPLKC